MIRCMSAYSAQKRFSAKTAAIEPLVLLFFTVLGPFSGNFSSIFGK